MPGQDEQTAHGGRTVLFVSHNMAQIEHLCRRVLVLDAGMVRADGPAAHVIPGYLKGFSPASGGVQDLGNVRRGRNLVPVVMKIELLDDRGQTVAALPAGTGLTVRVHYRHDRPIRDAYFGLTFETEMGVKVFWLQSRLQKGWLGDLKPQGVVTCRIPRVPLVPGTYYISSGCGSRQEQLDLVPRTMQIEIAEANVFGTGRLPSQGHGLVIVDAEWQAGEDTAA